MNFDEYSRKLLILMNFEESDAASGSQLMMMRVVRS